MFKDEEEIPVLSADDLIKTLSPSNQFKVIELLTKLLLEELNGQEAQ